MYDSEVARTPQQGNLSIGTVAKLTGISVHTLRAWEKRYQVVDVLRSDTGRRLYSTEDVHRLRLLRKLTQAGHSIGNVASLENQQLEQMLNLEFENDAARDSGEQLLEVCLFSDRALESPTLNGVNSRYVNIVLETNEVGELRETLSSKSVYVVVFIFQTVLKHQLRLLRQVIQSEPRHQYHIVFTAAQREMIDELKTLGFNMLRAPITREHLFEKLLQTRAPAAAPKAGKDMLNPSRGEVPPHRFTKKQLDALAKIPSAMDCECPHHIADLIHKLTMFEAYSQSCASKHTRDAYLHNKIYKITAQARTMMEEAITLVMEAENISIDCVRAEH